jgi:hypothetical protein
VQGGDDSDLDVDVRPKTQRSRRKGNVGSVLDVRRQVGNQSTVSLAVKRSIDPSASAIRARTPEEEARSI